MRSITFLSRLMKDDSGLETTEVALGIGLLAFIGGFGFFFLGDALSDFFAGSGDNIGDAPDPFGTNLPNGTYACDPATGTCGAT